MFWHVQARVTLLKLTCVGSFFAYKGSDGRRIRVCMLVGSEYCDYVALSPLLLLNLGSRIRRHKFGKRVQGELALGWYVLKRSALIFRFPRRLHHELRLVRIQLQVAGRHHVFERASCRRLRQHLAIFI